MLVIYFTSGVIGFASNHGNRWADLDTYIVVSVMGTRSSLRHRPLNPAVYDYDFVTKKQTPVEVSQRGQELAKAYGLWGSLAYNKNLYGMPSIEQLNQVLQSESNQ